MLEWYDMPGALDDFETNPAYLKKLEVDDVETMKNVIHARNKTLDHAGFS